MNAGTHAAIGLIVSLAFILFVVCVANYIEKVKMRRKVSLLKIGTHYTLDGKDPFNQSRVVIEDIMRGYVAYRRLYKREGGPDELGSLQSEKAESFARMYEECSRPGDEGVEK